MKKIVILLTVLSCMFTLSCGGGGGGGDDDPVPPESTPWLCFTAGENDCDFYMDMFKHGTVSSPEPVFEYSTDGGARWNIVGLGPNTPFVINLKNVGDKVYIKAKDKNDEVSVSIDNKNYRHIRFICTKSIAASGNIMSLLDGDCYSAIIPCNGCFESLFASFSTLTTAPELPAVTLTPNCYNNMFYGCTSLTKAPELPATILAEGCYEKMFRGCSSLTDAPELPATSLAMNCYLEMFKGCTSLVDAPELPAITLATGCYDRMFWDCTCLTNAPELPATTLKGGCYRSMFRNCINLTTAPELPATVVDNYLTPYCYEGMFEGCTSLNEITVHFTYWSAPGYYETAYWVSGIPEGGNFYCPATIIENGDPLDSGNFGPSKVPNGWTIHALLP